MADSPADDPYAFRDQFFDRNPNAKQVIDLFNYLPGVLFYAKDAEHRYIGVNQRTLDAVFGMRSDSELLGRTDLEFQPPALAEAYHSEDRRVMQGGETIANQVWLVPHVRGTPRWYVSSKSPLFDSDKRVIGLAGVMYPISTPEEKESLFQDLQSVIQFMDSHFDENISMKEMAERAGMSSTYFNSRFRELLRMSPTEYILSLRIQRAQRLLVETSESIVAVGSEVGFCDQSHFTKRFRRFTGMTPLAYRKRFR